MRFFCAMQVTLLGLALLNSYAWGGDEESAQELPPTIPGDSRVAEAVNTFGARLLAQYRTSSPQGNVVFSPLSLATAFFLLYQGAGGEAARELEEVFGFENAEVVSGLTAKPDALNRDETTLLASRLYVDEEVDVKESYKNLIGEERIEEVDFKTAHEEARVTINDWVKDKTNDLIPELISAGSLTPETLMVIVNALYFHGTWKMPFPIESTETATFRGESGDEEVPFMCLRDVTLIYKTVDELSGAMVELPYTNEEYSMYIFVPDTKNGWRRVENFWSSYAPSIFDTGTFNRQQVSELKMPRWELETSLNDLKVLLTNLGLSSVFSANADLSGISTTPLKVDDVVHKAKIVVDEKGTEAAAATAILSVRSAVAYPPKNITVDRPFLYFIVSKSDNTVLFQGTQTSIGGV